NDIIVIESKKFGYVIPHHDASERSRQRRDEQSMITTRDRAGNSTGGITAKPIGDEPFARKQKLARHLLSVPRHRTNDGPDCFKLPVHLSMLESFGQPNFRRFGWRRGVFSGTSRSATVASAGRIQRS